MSLPVELGAGSPRKQGEGRWGIRATSSCVPPLSAANTAGYSLLHAGCEGQGPAGTEPCTAGSVSHREMGRVLAKGTAAFCSRARCMSQCSLHLQP